MSGSCRTPKNEPGAQHNRLMLETEDMRLRDALRKALIPKEVREHIEQLQAEKEQSSETIEKVIDLFIVLPRWKMVIMRWIWPDIVRVCNTLREYCWKDCK